jgi:8-oxo-dGTP diphosphatase
MKEPRVRVAGIVVKNNSILFIKQEKNGKEYWLLPGGGLDFGETFYNCLKREFEEEVNIEIEPKEMLFLSEGIAPDMSRHIVSVYFGADWISGEIKVGEEAILKEVKFIDIKEIDKYTIYPNIKKELKEYVENKEIHQIKYISNIWE